MHERNYFWVLTSFRQCFRVFEYSTNIMEGQWFLEARRFVSTEPVRKTNAPDVDSRCIIDLSPLFLPLSIEKARGLELLGGGRYAPSASFRAI